MSYSAAHASPARLFYQTFGSKTLALSGCLNLGAGSVVHLKFTGAPAPDFVPFIIGHLNKTLSLGTAPTDCVRASARQIAARRQVNRTWDLSLQSACAVSAEAGSRCEDARKQRLRIRVSRAPENLNRTARFDDFTQIHNDDVITK
jgi:hypothetical protein